MSKNIEQSYPCFDPNQVLTDTQLNHLRDYLEQQNHLTRTCLIGTGIVCGLKAYYTFEEKKIDQEVHKVYLSGGYGITSMGYKLEHKAATYQFCREYFGKDADEDGREDYAPWANANYPIYELLVEETPPDPDWCMPKDTPIMPITEEELDCRILVLYLDKCKIDNQSCVVTDCSNKGAQVKLIPRVLMVHEDDIAPLEPCGQLLDGQKLKDLMQFVPRFHTQLENGCPETTDNIRASYGCIAMMCKKEIKNLLETIQKDNADRDDFLCLGDISWVYDRLDEVLPNKRSYDDFSQYHWSFVGDLVCALDEFLIAYCELVKSCGHPSGFDCHLMIRRLIEDSAAEDGSRWRHRFQPAPTKNQMHEGFDRTRKLFLRVLAMIRHFQSDVFFEYKKAVDFSEEHGGIKITPSHCGTHPLGQQAIPYYYYPIDESVVFDPTLEYPTQELDLIDLWESELCCTLEPLNSYHLQPDPYPGVLSSFEDKPPYSAYPLYYDVQKYSMYQIEGHLGRNCKEVKKELQAWRELHNLEFDICVVYIKEPGNGNPNERIGIPPGETFPPPSQNENLILKQFFKKNPGMEHIGGVKPCGTFILVCDPACPGEEDDIVVADFALDCCVQECKETEECAEITLRYDPPRQNDDREHILVFHVDVVPGTGPNPLTYDWDFGDGHVELDAGPTITHEFPDNGGAEEVTYEITVTAKGPGECEDRASVRFTLPGKCPELTGIQLKDDVKITEDQINYTAEVLVTSPEPDNFNWDWGDGTPTVINSSPLGSHWYARAETAKTYVLTVTSIGPGNCPERSIQVEIEVPAKKAKGPSTDPPSPSPEPIPDTGEIAAGGRGLELANLGARRTLRTQVVYDLNQGGSYQRNRTYQAALDFVQNDTLQAKELSDEFKDTLGKLKSVYKRATGDKKAGYQQMIQLVLLSYLDRLVETSPGALPTEARETIQREVGELPEYGLKASDLKKAWKASEAKKAMDNAKIIDPINRLLK